MICATPGLPLPAWVSLGHATVSPLPSVHVVGAAVIRYLVKLLVVPDASERCATTIAVLGKLTPLFVAAMAESFHFVILREKIPASVSASSCNLLTPDTLNDTVIGAATVGK